MTIKCPECKSKEIFFHSDWDSNYRFLTGFTQNSEGIFIPTFNSEDIKDIEKGLSSEDINWINADPVYSCKKGLDIRPFILYIQDNRKELNEI